METYEDDINLVKAGFENKPQEKIDYLSDCYKVFGLTSNVADKKEKQVSDDFEANKKQLKNAETKAKIGFVKEVEKTGYPIDKHDREKVAEHLAKAVKVSISLIHDEDENLSQDEIKETKSPKAIISTAYNMNLETSEPEGIQKLPEKTVFNPLMEQMVFEMYETMEKAHKDPEYKKAVVKSRKELKKLTSLKDNMESLRGAVKDNFFYANLQKTSNNKPETGKMDNELKVSLAKKAMQANRN
jgi:hypothetical protein